MALNLEDAKEASGSRLAGRRHHFVAAGPLIPGTAVVAPMSPAEGDNADAARAAVGISVVIPARNEADNIGWVLRRIPSYVDEVVIVDGRSTDATVAVARMVRPDVVVVTDNGIGKGDAMRVGAKAARGSIVVMMDADGSMDPAEIERFVEPLAQDFDFVKGSRFVSGGGTSDMTILRKAGHWALLSLANLMYGSRWTDLCYGFCAFRRSALEELSLDADGFEIETQMAVRSARIHLRIIEVPSFEYPRRFGNSQLNTFRDGWRVLCTIFQERIRRHPAGTIDEPGMADELIDA